MAENNYKIGKRLVKLGAWTDHQVGPLKSEGAFFSYSDVVDGLDNSSRVERQFSYSFDGKEWSMWSTLSNQALTSSIGDKTFWLRVRWDLVENLAGAVITVSDYTLKIEVAEVASYNPSTVLPLLDVIRVQNPYDIGKQFAKVQNDMDLWINRNFGVDVIYWHTDPDLKTVDAFLSEYSLHKVVNEGGTCLKVIIVDNLIPENKPEMNEWGIEFEQFEVQIDKRYFEETFGLNAKPRNEDYLYLKVANKMFYVFANYLKRGVNETATYYAMTLKTYEENTSVLKADVDQKFIEDNTLSQKGYFEETFKEEFADVRNEQQNRMKTVSRDDVREELHQSNMIVNETVYNNGTELLKNFYDFTSIPSDEVAVKYVTKNFLKADGAIAISVWIKLLNKASELTYNVQSQQNAGPKLVKLTLDRSVRNVDLNEGDALKSVGYFYVQQIIDDYNVVVASDALLSGADLANLTKTAKNNIYTSIGQEHDLQIDLHDGKDVVVRADGRQQVLPAVQMVNDKWYNVTVNISNTHSYFGVYVWSLEGGGDRNATTLALEFKKESHKVGVQLLDESQPFMTGSTANFSNVRIYRTALDFNFQSRINGVRVLPKPSVAFVIDDAQTIFNNRNVSVGILDDRKQFTTEFPKESDGPAYEPK